MSKPICKNCNKRRFVIQKYKKEKGKTWLVTICATCKHGIDIEIVKEDKK